MKKNIIGLLWVCLLMVIVASCSREALNYGSEVENGSDNGNSGAAEIVELNLRGVLQLDVKVNNVPATRTSTVSTDDFIVTLYKEDGTKVENCEWKFSEMPELISVLQGNYYVKVRSHDLLPFDLKPYYEGISEVFAVAPGAITEVKTIVCSMANIKVMVTIDATLDKYLTPDAFVTISVGNATYPFNDLEEANYPIYFAPTGGEKTIITAIFQGTIDGYPEKVTQSKSASAGSSVVVNFTLKNVTDGEVNASGSASLKLSLDMSLTVFDKDYNINAGEEVLPDDDPDDGGDEDETKPTIKGRGFNIDNAQSVPKDGMTCIVDITAADRLANLYVTIDSETLTESVLTSVGLKKEFDLAYPGELTNALGKDGLGFPVGNEVIGQKSLVFDISPFTQLLNIYGAATHKFIIKVVDQKGVELEKTLTLVTQ